MQITKTEKQTLGAYIRVAEIAKLIQVSQATIWRWKRIGHFPQPVKLGAKVTAWKAQDVQAWMDKQGGAV